MFISFFRMDRHLEKMRDEIFSSFERVFKSGRFISGEEVKEFENAFSKSLNIKYSLAVSSGTDAILLSLISLGIGQGDEVITTPYTFFASVGSILRVGAKPVFVDIEKNGFNINPLLIENAITPKTKAILPVHLFGKPAMMDKIMNIANKYKLFVIEDAAQAVKASVMGKYVGSIGDIGCFSFFPSKNLGGFGDGGMVTTSVEELYEKVKLLRNHGMKERFIHYITGGNHRMDEIQAAILRVKIKYIDEWTEKRRKIAKKYIEIFNKEGLEDFITIPEFDGSQNVYNQFILRVKERDELKNFLLKNGVETAIYYPLPLYLQPALLYLGYKEGDFPQAEKSSKENLAIPIYPEIEEGEQEYVASKICEFYKRRNL